MHHHHACLQAGAIVGKRQAPDVTALPNSQCVIALLPKSKSYVIIWKMVNLLLSACPHSPQMIALM